MLDLNDFFYFVKVLEGGNAHQYQEGQERDHGDTQTRDHGDVIEV